MDRQVQQPDHPSIIDPALLASTLEQEEQLADIGTSLFGSSGPYIPQQLNLLDTANRGFYTNFASNSCGDRERLGSLYHSSIHCCHSNRRFTPQIKSSTTTGQNKIPTAAVKSTRFTCCFPRRAT